MPSCSPTVLLPLQWGRSTSLRKTLVAQVIERLTSCFNGAAAHRCGKRLCSQQTQSGFAPLQWGRSTSLRKTGSVHDVVLRQVAASMGPQHIAAENSIDTCPLHELDGSFNGAAAHRCGKLQFRRGERTSDRASMGPQHIAAENLAGADEHRATQWASMGPQHIAAENGEAPRILRGFHGASMGPQHIAAENRIKVDENASAQELQWGRSTSLRKTVDDLFLLLHFRRLQWGRSTSLRKTTALRRYCVSSDQLQWGRSTSLRKTALRRRAGVPCSGFNGAAAHRCGKPAEMAAQARKEAASMGPQHIAAENSPRLSSQKRVGAARVCEPCTFAPVRLSGRRGKRVPSLVLTCQVFKQLGLASPPQARGQHCSARKRKGRKFIR